MLHIKGKNLPKSVSIVNELEYPKIIAQALKSELGDSRKAIKTLMDWTDVCERKRGFFSSH